MPTFPVAFALFVALTIGPGIRSQTTLGPAGSLPATEPAETCDVLRNNVPLHYTSTLVAATGEHYSHEIYQPPGFDSNLPTDPGIAAGSTTWRWIPARLNRRLSTRHVTGFYAMLYPSAPTVTFPFTGYVPEWSIVPTRVRPDGGHEPDPNRVPHLTVPRASFVFASRGAKRARTAFSLPVPLDGVDDVCLQYRWDGGEHRMRQGSQSFVGTAGEAPWKVPTWGYGDPLTGVPTVVDTYNHPVLAQHSTLWMSYYERDPTIIVESDYAHERMNAPGPENYSGFCDAAGLCDLGTRPLDVGWSADVGVRFAGALCVPLFNLSSNVNTVAVPFGRTTLDIDVTNGLLTFLTDLDYFGYAGPDGWFTGHDGDRLTLDLLGPSSVGSFLGVEYLVADPATLEILASTQAHWIEVLM